jgi:tetratricopeptide (TPR) repeat protein
MRGSRLAMGSRCFVATVTLAVLLAPIARSTDNPGETLKRGFDAAKSALAAGDLPDAENKYKHAIALGLRQMGKLSISESRFEEGTREFDEALKLGPDDPELQVDAATAWFQRGNVNKARDLAQRVLADNRNHARARNVLGRIELFAQNFDAAIENLQSSVALENNFETSYFLGLAYLEGKKIAEGKSWFRELQAAMGDSAALHMLFGRAYLIAHFPEPAVSEFRTALKLDPKYPRAHGLLGYAYLEFRGEEAYPQARAEFEKELKLNPEQYHVLLLLGISTASLRDFPAAEAALLHASRLKHEQPLPYLYLGETYSQTNRFGQAVEALQRFVKLVPNPKDMMRDISRAYFLLGQSLMRIGRVEEGKRALASSQKYREAKFRYDERHIFDERPRPSDTDSRTSDRVAELLEAGAPEEDKTTEGLAQKGMPEGVSTNSSAPQHAMHSPGAKQYRAFASEILASSYNDLGVMRAKDSKFAEASEFFKQAAKWKPDLAGMDRNWGLASYRAGSYAEAVDPLARQLSAHPDDALVRQLLGMSYFMTDNYPKTADVLRPFLSRPPDDPGLLYAWGVALVRTEQSGTAAQVFQRLLQQNADNPQVHLLLGQAYAQQERYPNALGEMTKALQLNARIPEAHYYAGLVHLHQSEFDAAAQEFRAELQLRPGDPVTCYHLGLALLSTGDADSAAPLFREAIRGKPDYELAHFELGRALLKTGDLAGAIENLEAAKKLVPQHDAVYYQLNQAYRNAGRMQEAEQSLAMYRKLIEASRLRKRESLEAEKP